MYIDRIREVEWTFTNKGVIIIVDVIQVRPLVASVLDGFNGCVFAYGQTGTGKTHTMEGTVDHEGIIPRAFRHLWAHIENTASPDVTHLVSCSYVELYLEDVRDLLAKDCKKLTIRGQVSFIFYRFITIFFCH